jgi:Ni/Co efflux regulator RcnB
MKSLLCSVAAIALMFPSTVLAQRRDNPNQNQSAGQTRPARPSHNRPGRPTTKPLPARPGQGHRPGHRPPTTKPVPARPGNGHRPGHGHRPPVTIQPIRPNPGHRPGYRPPHVRPIHRPAYRYPHGYHYRRWHVGLLLPHIFLSNYYYFNDWRLLGLGPPPHGYVWVRYGPDLLLVDRYTGRIRDVIYGAFY